MVKKVGLYEALCGFRSAITTIGGKKVHFSRPPGIVTKPCSIMMIKGKGMPVHKTNSRGNLFVRFEITFPAKMVKADAQLLLEVLPAIGSNSINASNETEEYHLVDYDPKFRVTSQGRSAYDDERLVDKDVLNRSFSEKCSVQ